MGEEMLFGGLTPSYHQGFSHTAVDGGPNGLDKQETDALFENLAL